MSDWSLVTLLSSLHEDIENRLTISRKSIPHPGAKGDASESVWLDMLNKYLPKRYQAETGFVIDSKGNNSEQIDVIIFDRQYSPFIFNFEGQKVIPAESVYAVFEAKQTANANYINYAQNKVRSVRQLFRTSLPIPHAGGTYPPKPLIQILGGVLTLESEWSPACDQIFRNHLEKGKSDSQLNIGCIAAHGHFFYETSNAEFHFCKEGKPATAFLFKLISMLQFSGTVPMIDVGAYAKWLDENKDVPTS